MQKLLRWLTASAVSAVLSFMLGCQPITPQDNGISAGSSVTASSAENQLLETATSIEHSLAVLASAQEAKSPPVIRTAPLITREGGMGGTADIDWVGPIAPLLRRVAEMTNYRVKVLGNPPAIPVVVTINAQNTVIADILQNASLQIGQRAQILVFPENRVIELRYLSS